MYFQVKQNTTKTVETYKHINAKRNFKGQIRTIRNSTKAWRESIPQIGLATFVTC